MTHRSSCHSEDHGSGQPVVLIPAIRSRQLVDRRTELLAAGYRFVSYDRRGSAARVSRPCAILHTFAGSTSTLFSSPGTSTCVASCCAAFSMGTGEIACPPYPPPYLGTYGSAR